MSGADRYAVFGHPIGHSKSPLIHARFAELTGQDLVYSAEDVPAERFDRAAADFFAAGGKGLNCTVPLKELAWRYAGQLTPRARLAGAVNTLAVQAGGGVLGDNTDGVGLIADLRRNHGIDPAGRRILVLGAGGAARGILGPLLDCKPAGVALANRTAARAEAIAAEFAGYGELAVLAYPQLAGLRFDLLINATAASLSGELPPLPDDLLAGDGCCYDLAYASQPTAFVAWGLEHGAARSLDGLGMLVEQAAEAFLLWRGVRPPTAALLAELNAGRH